MTGSAPSSEAQSAPETPVVPTPGAYIGRFAPSPSGPLHRGSLVAAMASYLDAMAHDGQWLLRIEDIDTLRSRADAAAAILRDLSALGFRFDPQRLWYQSQRLSRYQQAFDKLTAQHLLYACRCSRKEIADSLSQRGMTDARIYPGTCRPDRPALFVAPATAPLRAWRVQVPARPIRWTEGDWLSPRASPLAGRTQSENLAQSLGDFVIARPASGAGLDWTYQLSVVVDDGDAGITHVVRGLDLIDSTARQIHLQQCLGLPTPHYWHCPLVMGADGQKLSKQNGAAAIDTRHPLPLLQQALRDLGLPAVAMNGESLAEFWLKAVAQWRHLRLGREAVR